MNGARQTEGIYSPMSSQHTIQAHLASRRDNFLLLRIIAALMVIYGHSFPLTRDIGTTDIFLQHHWPLYSGDIAVAMFFVISGFMVSGSYIGRADLFDFAKARLLRIVPAFALVLALCAWVVGPLMTTLATSDYFRDPAVAAYVFKNLRFSSDMAWQLPGVFQDQVRDAVNGSIWTLPAEMRMYLFTAALGAFGLLAHRWLGTAVLLVLVVYLSMRVRSMPWLFALCLAYFCFWFAYRTPTWRWLERWGDPSYGIYLWGWPVQQVLVVTMPGMTPWHNFLVAAPFAVCLGYLSWRCLERPALKLKGWRPGFGGRSLLFRSRQSGVDSS